MLGKLTKYEFRATSRIMLVFYGALIVMTILNRIMGGIMSLTNLDESGFNMLASLPTMLTWFLYGVCIAAVGVMSIVLIVQRFYKNLLQDEGYLMHVLPVKTWQHIASKLIAALVWAVLSVFVVSLSLTIVSGMGAADYINLLNLFAESLSSLRAEFGTGSTLFSGFLSILLIIAWFASEILKLYASMAIGQMADRHKVFASFGAYIGVSIVESIVESLGITAGGRIFMSTGMYDWTGLFAVDFYIFVFLAYMVVLAGIYFAVSNVFMKKHLNLA